MTESFQLGGRRRRSSSGEGWLLLIALIIAGFTYMQVYAPMSSGSWEAAATQIRKKYDRVLLFYPAWERQALRDLQELAVVSLDGPQHFELAGLREVLFSAEGPGPEQLVRNLFAVSEWRDFAGKAVAVLRVADRGLVVDFNRLSIAVEDPPGIAACEISGETARCAQPNVVIERREARRDAPRCVWVKTNPDRPLFLRWRDLEGQPMKRAMLFVWPGGDGQPSSAGYAIELFAHAQRAGRLEGSNAFAQQAVVLEPASDEVEIVIDAPNGACFDAELMQ